MSASDLPNSDAINNDAVQHAKQLLSTNSTDTTQSLKRPNTDDDDDLNLQPAKKQNPTNSIEMASMGMGGALGGAGVGGGASVDYMEVPESAVGLVIGRGGEQITSIQAQSGCRVQLAADGTGSGMRQCTLQGSPQAIERAKVLITETMSRARANTMMMNPTNGGPQFVTQQLLIPGTKCGLIIGKNGETIKSMQESIGVKMLLIQESQQSGALPKPLRITGTADKVDQAKRAVELLLANDESNSRLGGGNGGGGSISGGSIGGGTGGNLGAMGGMGGMGSGGNSMMTQTRSMGEVIVPRSSVGIIIGKQGETIKRLAAESGTKIQFKNDVNPTTAERCAVIHGTPQQIERATNLIWDLVQRANGNAQQEVCLMHVPANKTGLVIGKGGDTIKSICNEAGAHVELSRDPPPNASEKVFVIKGTPYQIHMAQHMIRIKVGDLQPGTPAPPFQGMQVGGFQAPQYNAGGGGDQFGAQQQWPGNGYGAAAQNPNWAANQYYEQPQQQQQQASNPIANIGSSIYEGYIPRMPSSGGPQQQMMQSGVGAQMAGAQQQQPAGAVPGAQGGGQTGQPAINPATGQPDYSAQWAEYYRSVGLLDQAKLIEQQMQAATAPAHN